MSKARSYGCSLSGGWGQIRWVISRATAIVLNEGGSACLRRITHKLSRMVRGQARILPFSHRDLDAQYRQWRMQHAVTPVIIETMRQDVGNLSYHPVINLVMSMSNTQPSRVRKAIESVCGQVYPHWNLYLFPDSEMSLSAQHVIEDFVAKDRRITLRILSEDNSATSVDCPLLSLQSGAFVGLIGQHDELAPEALFAVVKQLNECPSLDLLYSDHDTITPDGEYVDPFFKPGWSPDLFLSMNYLSHLCVFRRSVLWEIEEWAERIVQGSTYDLLLRFTEKTSNICHIPQVLYHVYGGTVADVQVSRCEQSHETVELTVVQEALRRRGEYGKVICAMPDRFRIACQARGTSLVSIIIPTRDRWELLDQCLGSIRDKTSYVWYEIIVLDNGSTDPQTLYYLDTVAEKWRVHRCPGPFNFSSINNVGAAQAKGEYLLFLNNDVKVISQDWLTAMVAQAQRSGVGAVGAKLLYPDGSIQHAGVVLGVDGVASHAFRHSQAGVCPYYGFADIVRNCSAVTAACMLVSKEAFGKVHGFDERLAVEFNDVDLCLRIQQQGYRIVYTPDAVLYHYENATRRGRRSPEDEALFEQKWSDLIMKGDPYYNPNLTRLREDWSLNV